MIFFTATAIFDRTTWIGCLAFLLLLSGVPDTRADYVRYFHTFGAWSVTCWWDRVTDKENCSLESPPPSLDPHQSDGVLKIMKPEPDAIELTVEIRGTAATGHPVRLEVDGRSRHETVLDVTYHARWRGAKARALVRALWRAERATLYWRSRNGAGHKEPISLRGFRDALKDFRVNLHRRGISDDFGELPRRRAPAVKR